MEKVVEKVGTEGGSRGGRGETERAHTEHGEVNLALTQDVFFPPCTSCRVTQGWCIRRTRWCPADHSRGLRVQEMP